MPGKYVLSHALQMIDKLVGSISDPASLVALNMCPCSLRNVDQLPNIYHVVACLFVLFGCGLPA